VLSRLFKFAVLSGAQAAVRFHIQRGVDINATDSDGKSPLMLAALNGYVETCRLLLEAGADPMLVDREGRDAFTLAQSCGRPETGTVIRGFLPLGGVREQPVHQLPGSTLEQMEGAVADFPDGERRDLSDWQVEIEPQVPFRNDSCLVDAKAVQHSLSLHTPIDTAEDWSDVEIVFPDRTPRRFGDDLREGILNRIRHAFFDGLRDGSVPLQDIESLCGQDEERDEDLLAHLFMAITYLTKWTKCHRINHGRRS